MRRRADMARRPRQPLTYAADVVVDGIFVTNAELLVSNAWDASGSTTQHQAWVIGARKFPTLIWLEGTPASLVDPLFTKPSDGGLGLSKTRFVSTAGFNVLDYTGGFPGGMRCHW